MLNVLKMFALEERGQGMTEYSLILVLLVVGVISILAAMGPKVAQKFQNISSKM